MPYIGNVLTSFAVETGNINDQAVTAPKLSATGGTDGQILALDSNLNLAWVSDPAGQWVTSGTDLNYTAGDVGIGTSSPDALLHVSGADTAIIRLENSDTSLIADQIIGGLEFEKRDPSGAGAGVVGGLRMYSKGSVGESVYLTLSTSGSSTNDVEALRIDAAGRLLVGAEDSTDQNAKIQVGTTVREILEGFNYANDALGSRLRLAKSRNTSIGSQTIVQDDDELGLIAFSGSDGTNYRNAALIRGFVDGTPGSGDMPGRLVFSTTADGSSSPTERMRIDSSGRLLIGTTSQSNSALLTIEGNTGNNSGSGELTLQRGEPATSMSSGDSIGHIYFQDNSNNRFAEITVRSDGASGSNDYPGRIMFHTTADGASSVTERMRIDSSGRLLVGTSTARTLFPNYTPQLQNEGTSFSTSSVSFVQNSNSAGGPCLYFGKSRGTSVGSNTVVQNGDELGVIAFNGADGTDVQSIGAIIRANVDGTPGSNDMPGRLVFLTTADGGSSPTERLRIDNSGKISTGGESSPDVSAGGLCLDQNAEDGIILSFKSSDINHGITTLDETDTYFSVRKVSGDKGGVRIRSYTDAAGGDPAVLLTAYINSDTDQSYVPITLLGGKKDGTGTQNIATNRRIVEFKNADGTRIASFTGTGLTFGNDSGTANALDDYEEGDWVPAAFNGANGASTTSVTSREARYVKVGGLVHISCYITVVKGTNTSQSFEIYGLPFTVGSDHGLHSAINVGYISGFNTSVSMVQATAQPSSSRILIRALTGTSDTISSTLDANNLNSSMEIILGGTYYTQQ